MKIVRTIIVSVIITAIFSLTIFPLTVSAQTESGVSNEELLEAEVTNILEEGTREYDGVQQLYQQLELKVTKGTLTDETITVENGEVPLAQVTEYEIGDHVVVSYTQNTDGSVDYFITDYVRRSGLLYLFLIFILLSLIVGRKWGATSILGMAYSFFIIFKFILPQLIAGHNPVLIAIAGATMIIPVTFYLSHGINKKTTIAVASTVIALIITGIIASVFLTASHLTGYGSDEAQFLQIYFPNEFDMRGLLLAGIIIGALGILDDITVSQAAIVKQLKAANPSFGFGELYSRAMSVGRDHIASLINTLILVYTGAALPLLLLFVNDPRSYETILNLEIVAEEIVRTLTGTIGIVLAVPLTTALAAYIMRNMTIKETEPEHFH